MPGTRVYVSNAESKDIHVFDMDRDSGKLTLLDRVAVPGTDLPSPTSLPMAVSPDRRFLYAALRSPDYPVSTFAIDPETGHLTHLGSTPLVAAMAYITTDRTGAFLLCASYTDAKLAVYPIGADGVVESPPTQIIPTGPHAHCIVVDQPNRFAYSAILGSDHVMQMQFDAREGTLSAIEPATLSTRPGAGPRHLALHPNGRHLYLLNQTHATVSALRIEAGAGTLAETEMLTTLPAHFLGEANAADIHLTPDGRFLYTSERQTSTMSAFRVDADSGVLWPLGRWPTETTPRGFAVDPRGRFVLVAGLDSNSVSVHAIAEDGTLGPQARVPVGAMPNWIEIIDLAG